MKVRWILFSTLLVSAVLAAQDGAGRAASELGKKADSIRATADEWKFMQIPWVTDLFAGFRMAREENRPVFLYTIHGDPLDDC